ncbi:MAG TPA: hypothetical protein VI197_00860 [Polyangiaceae bacterium]
MVNLEELSVRGLRAYEVGRLRAALRVVLVLAPAVVLCALEARTREACICVGVLLLSLSVWLRWRDRDGSEAVSTGLWAGGIPYSLGLALERFGVHCGSAELAAYCWGFSGLFGLGAGAIVAAREARQRARASGVAVAAAIAILAATLGCLRLGVASVVAVAVGTAIGVAIRRRPA